MKSKIMLLVLCVLVQARSVLYCAQKPQEQSWAQRLWAFMLGQKDSADISTKTVSETKQQKEVGIKSVFNVPENIAYTLTPEFEKNRREAMQMTLREKFAQVAGLSIVEMSV